MPNNTMVFKHPGPQSVDGVSFDYLIVLDEELDATYADGWSRSVPEAKAAHDAAQAPVEAPAAPAEDAAPTRAELEQKAGELGIKFDGRTSDKSLAGKIADALKA